MNADHLGLLCAHFNLGNPDGDFERIHGGLMHIMWRINTDKGQYAVKQLSQYIDLSNPDIIQNYELTEQIAARFAENDIPSIFAISKSNKCLFISDGIGYLVYNWVYAQPISREDVIADKALKIANIIARMHNADIKIEGLAEVDYEVKDDEDIKNLASQSSLNKAPFALYLEQHIENIIEINGKYRDAIHLLKNHSVICHGDIDQKNVLWTIEEDPLIIDWEAARKLNPTYEIINAALDWSGISTHLDYSIFQKMLLSYEEAGGIIEKDLMRAAICGVMGNWINWLMYNVNRYIISTDADQKEMSAQQVTEVLPSILRINSSIDKLLC